MNFNEYNCYNRYQNLDGLEARIAQELIKSDSVYAKNFWRLLKYNDLNALSRPNLTRKERKDLVCFDSGKPTSKRVFFAPFTDDAWQEQCASVYIYVEDIIPIDHMRSKIGVTIETVVHSKIAAITGNGDPTSNVDQHANPNDSDDQGNIVVTVKNRATVLLKCLIAELNGLYLNGIGYLQLNQQLSEKSKTSMNLWNKKSFYGHTTEFFVMMSGVSDNSEEGF